MHGNKWALTRRTCLYSLRVPQTENVGDDVVSIAGLKNQVRHVGMRLWNQTVSAILVLPGVLAICLNAKQAVLLARHDSQSIAAARPRPASPSCCALASDALTMQAQTTSNIKSRDGRSCRGTL